MGEVSLDRRWHAPRRGQGRSMPRRMLEVDGQRWEVSPSGRTTQYLRDEFGVVFSRPTAETTRAGGPLLAGRHPEQRARWPRCRSSSFASCSSGRSRPGPRPKRSTGADRRREAVDLHSHSTASDGERRPTGVADAAHRAGLAAIALTDHDTLDGVPELLRAAARIGLRVVSGCEFSVQAPWGEMHLLGYFLPPGSAPLNRSSRRGRPPGAGPQDDLPAPGTWRVRRVRRGARGRRWRSGGTPPCCPRAVPGRPRELRQ